MMAVVCWRSVSYRCTCSESRTSRQQRSSAAAISGMIEPCRVSCGNRFSTLSTISGVMPPIAATQGRFSFHEYSGSRRRPSGSVQS